MTSKSQKAIWSIILSVTGMSILLWSGHWVVLIGIFFLMWGDKVGEKAYQDSQDPIGNLLTEWKRQDARKRNRN